MNKSYNSQGKWILPYRPEMLSDRLGYPPAKGDAEWLAMLLSRQRELDGQLSLFTVDGCDQEIQDQFADEVCKHCGGHCTSSSECVEIEQSW